jgi:predicted Zn-dependent peptidase
MLLELLTKPSFPEAELAKERAQVLSSLATRRDTIFNIAHDRLAERLFGSHPYGRLVDGLPGTVQRFKRRDLQAWHAAYVAPAGAILSIVASVPWPEVLAETKRTLGRWRKNGAAWRSPALFLPAALSASVEEEIRAPFEQAYLMTGMLAPKADDPDFFALKLLNTALGGGMSSRLFLQLREERGLAYEVSSFFATRLQASQWVIYLGCSPKNLDVAQRHLEALLRQVASEGVSAMELKQAKAMMKGSFALDFQTRRRQAWYGAWWRFLGRGAHYERRFGPAVDAVQSADVRRAARRLLSQPRVTIKVVPKG